MSRTPKRILLVTACLVINTLAQIGVADPKSRDDKFDDRSVSLTIYSDTGQSDSQQHWGVNDAKTGPITVLKKISSGYATVWEARKISLASGLNSVRFSDVSSAMDPATVVFNSRTAPDSTTIVEQLYQYDMANTSDYWRNMLGMTSSSTGGRSR